MVQLICTNLLIHPTNKELFQLLSIGNTPDECYEQVASFIASANLDILSVNVIDAIPSSVFISKDPRKGHEGELLITILISPDGAVLSVPPDPESQLNVARKLNDMFEGDYTEIRLSSKSLVFLSLATVSPDLPVEPLGAKPKTNKLNIN